MSQIIRIAGILTAFFLFFSCEKEEEPPILEVLSPLNNAEFRRGEPVLISVEAKGVDSPIKEVRFYLDGMGIASVVNFPYNFEWDTNNASLGKHIIKVVAIDENNLDSEISLEIIVEIYGATVITSEIEQVNIFSAVCTGEILDNGGAEITERGICWSANPDPFITDNKIPEGTGLGNFEIRLEDLEPNKTYYIKAYGINEKEVSYGEEKSFTTPEFEFLHVSGGTFMMGSDEGMPDERPIHEVTLSDFKMSKYEVTHVQFIDFLNDISCNGDGTFTDEEYGLVSYLEISDTTCAVGHDGINFYFRGSSKAINADCPVSQVTWFGANAFCKWMGGRLPTEAEMKFAARGGNESKGYIYSGSNNIDEVAWYIGNSNEQTHPIGQKKANELGFHDLTGNVWEWCSDWYDSGYYAISPSSNPQGPVDGLLKSFHTSSFIGTSYDCLIPNRGNYPPSKGGFGGIRVVRSL